MDAVPTGLSGSLPMDYPSYEGRSFEATVAPFVAPPSMPLPLPQPLRLPSPQLVEELVGQKSSRYLREMDRRTILARLDRGEKQSALAKEFRVTRAAICNLNKHRDLVLARRHEDPLAKHPKKSRRKSEAENETETEEADAEIRPPLDPALSSPRETPGSGLGRLLPPTVHSVALQPAERLLPLLSSRKTSDAAFRRYCDRLMTLVVEETLAWAHSEAHRGKISSSGGDSEPLKPCGVAVEPQGSPLLSVFQALEPELPTGRIQLALPRLAAPVAAVLELPAALEAHNVCLFYAFTDTAGGLRVAESIRALLDRGAVEELLCLVTLAVSTLTVGELQRAHPSLRIAAAHVERPEDVDDWIRDDRKLQSRADTQVEMKDSSEPSRLTSRLELLAARVNEVY
ncbi:hypothetical protein BBJ28_00001842 [Nothophytophthora sp. Chile5]|nr:hypothetical protein BBJ28_00001842 [Nothophytophthora sp. Chile5]